MRIAVNAAIIGLLVFLPPAFADRGGVPYKFGTRVFEPNQNALIAWDGQEETLILTTDMSSSEPTKVLEMLPLPSEPVVTQGDIGIFARATELINKKSPLIANGMDRGMLYKSAGDSADSQAQRPAGEITLHERMGVNDISVAHVLNAQGFEKWVLDYLVSAGAETKSVPQDFRDIVTRYVNGGFRWFVFDVVDLDGTTRSNDALQYRFKTGALFYPLQISSKKEGYTSISLLVLTPKLLTQFTGMPFGRIRIDHYPVDVTAEELQGISPEIFAELAQTGPVSTMKLRIWEIGGMLSSFDKDLVVSGFGEPERSPEFWVGKNELATGTLRTLSTCAETYATANTGVYPENMEALTGATPPYLHVEDDPCGKTVKGYDYTCRIAAEGYIFTATAQMPGRAFLHPWKQSIITGGALVTGNGGEQIRSTGAAEPRHPQGFSDDWWASARGMPSGVIEDVAPGTPAVLKPDTGYISYWPGQVNEHKAINGPWDTDPDGSGAKEDPLAYCQKWFSDATSVHYVGNQVISGWGGRVDDPRYTTMSPIYECRVDGPRF